MINILMLSAGVITGSLQMVIDIIESCPKNEFRFFVTHKPCCSGWGDAEIQRLKNAGALVLELRGGKLFHPLGLFDILAIIKQKKIHIVHCWDVLGLFGRIAGKLLGAKVIVEWQNPPPEIGEEISVKHHFFNYFSSVLVDGYIACSKGVMQRYVEERRVILTGRKIGVIPNFVDEIQFQPISGDHSAIRRRYGIEDDVRLLLTVGYFNPQKRHQDTIKALSILRSKGRKGKLIIVGWGELDTELKALVESLKLKDDVIFAGKCTRESVIDLLSIADLFVLSSHWEGFGIVLIEAMAMEIPVIATATDGARHIIEDGKNGLLVPIGNPERLADKLSELWDDPDRMVQMGREGRKRVIQYFNRYNFGSAHESFYRQMA